MLADQGAETVQEDGDMSHSSAMRKHPEQQQCKKAASEGSNKPMNGLLKQPNRMKVAGIRQQRQCGVEASKAARAHTSEGHARVVEVVDQAVCQACHGALKGCAVGFGAIIGSRCLGKAVRPIPADTHTLTMGLDWYS